MEASNIRIAGLDPARPPLIQAKPCIDLFFEFEEQASPAWCDIFNASVNKERYTVSINRDEGLFIETWVRTATEIDKTLTMLKGKVAAANARLDDDVRKSLAAMQVGNADSTSTVVVSPAQADLNAVVASLVFE